MKKINSALVLLEAMINVSKSDKEYYKEEYLEADTKTLSDARAELTQLKEMMREMEYTEKWDTSSVLLTFCPCCKEDKMNFNFDDRKWYEQPHKPDCRLALFLKEG
jgi:hypothetical protein